VLATTITITSRLMKKIAVAFTLLSCFSFTKAHAQHVPPPCNDYERTLEAMRTADQALRHRIGELTRFPEADAKTIKKVTGHIILVDRTNTAKLVSLVKQCGWPRPKIHGEKAVDYAWLIAQHADMNQTAQRTFLKHLKQAVDSGDSPAYTYAFLADRIALNEGKPQQYGTQVENKTECDVVIVPLDDYAKADARRKTVGWPSLKDYVFLLTKHLKEKGCPAPHVAIGTELPPPLYR
jgi:hypothetical protein